MSFDTTTQVRVFRGSTPTDGSHWIQTMSPRRTSTGSRFIVEQIELRRLEVFQKCAGVRPSGRVIRGEALAALYAKQMYPSRRHSAHPEYWSAQCRDGGKLDLRPASHAWPS